MNLLAIGVVLGGAMAALPAMAAPTEPNALVHPLEQPGSCSGCHAFANAIAHDGEPLYAPQLWQGSLMANAARDPVFWAGVAIAHQDAPGETEDCIRCHAPRAFLEGRGQATSVHELQPADLAGVECDLCHRMIDDGQPLVGNARYVIDDVAMPGQVAKRGPWTYRDWQPPHPWADGSLQASSRLCGTCHDVTTSAQRVDDNGAGIGLAFNEQRTYSEWANSIFSEPGPDARSCQDCHMPAVADVAGCANQVDVTSHPTGGRRHELVGANRFVLELLRDLYGNAGDGTVPDYFFDYSIDRMNTLLGSAASLRGMTPEIVDLTAGLNLAVRVTNHTGHKLPTGYSEGRMMWLEVIVRYGDEIVWSSGAWQPSSGPEQDAQLRSYQAIAEDYADKSTFHLLRNNHWVEDTRIPPRGLKPDLETDPVGDRYSLQTDGTWPNFDDVLYTFEPRPDIIDRTPAEPNDDTVEISLRLMYLINTPDYIEFLAEQNTTNMAGNDLAAMFDARGGATPIVLAEQRMSVQAIGLMADDTGGSTSETETSATVTEGATTGETDTDAGIDDGGRSSCSCTAAATPAIEAWLVVVVLLAMFRRTGYCGATRQTLPAPEN